MNVTSLMRQAAQLYAENPAVIFGNKTLTFSEAWERGVRLANALRKLGLNPGDRVGVLEDNCLESSDIFQGSAIANLVRVPLYARNSKTAHLHMLKYTGCRALIVSKKFEKDVADLKSECTSLEYVIVRDESYEEWLSSFSPAEEKLTISADDAFIIRHTGGTTGKPKGVMSSHKAWLACCRDWFYIFPQVNPGDKCLHVASIAHGSGYQYLPIWLAGGCNVLMDHFDANEVMETLEKQQIAFTLLPPPMLSSIIHSSGGKEWSFSKLKCILTGTAPISDATLNRSREIFGDVFYQGYGATECPTVAFMGPDQWFSEVPGSTPMRACGMPLPFVRVEIWDEDNNSLPIGSIGEIVAKADGQLSGFWDNADETAKRMVNGWIKLGDIGRLDDNGYLYLLDRKDDVIISGGFNIWPTEIENVIASLEDVVEVSVFGVPHEKWGETPVAVCCVKNEEKITEDDVRNIVSQQLGSYKKPSQVIIQTEPLPKTAVGKIQRRALREKFWIGMERSIAGA